MPSLREAAAQALEALEIARMNGKAGLYPAEIEEIADAITALKSALVEDAMQKFTDVNQELQAALGCDHCNSPLYAATKCRVCGRETPIIEPEIKGDNKPVAWYHVPYPGNGAAPMVSLSKQHEPSMYGAVVPLYLKEQL